MSRRLPEVQQLRHYTETLPRTDVLRSGQPVAIWRSANEARLARVPEHFIWNLAEQVVEAVAQYNLNHPGEMLDKTAAGVMQQFEAGHSCLMALPSEDPNQPWQLAYHGSLYPMFEQGEDNFTGIQVVELGTDITHESLRGQGLGQLGLQHRLDMLNQWRRGSIKVLGLSTVKQAITGYVYGKMHVDAINFADYPYLSWSTDTCEKTSERFGHQSCVVRRDPEDQASRRDLFRQIGGRAVVPCTLLATDEALAAEFDGKMRHFDQVWYGQSVPPGEISVEAYQHIGQVYGQLTHWATTR